MPCTHQDGVRLSGGPPIFYRSVSSAAKLSVSKTELAGSNPARPAISNKGENLRSLFFIGRHGETILNQKGFYRGWSDGPDAALNEDGIRSAHDEAKFLQSLKQPFSKIICSPLQRALLTAAIIAEYLDVATLEVDDRLMPLNVGDFAGQPKKDHPIQPFLDNKNKRFPNGETINEFEFRQHDFADYLLKYVEQEKRTQDPEILVIAHVSNVMYWWNLQTGAN